VIALAKIAILLGVDALRIVILGLDPHLALQLSSVLGGLRHEYSLVTSAR